MIDLRTKKMNVKRELRLGLRKNFNLESDIQNLKLITDENTQAI